MNITCSHSRLKVALESCERVISRHLTLPILNNIFLKADKNSLVLKATNLEVGITITVPCKTEEEGEMTVPAKVLYGIVANLSDETVELSSDKKGSLHVKTKGYKGSIKGSGTDEFPIIPTLKSKPSLSTDGRVLSDALSHVVPFTAVSETRPELTGVLFFKDKKEENMEIVAADGFRMGRMKIPVSAGEEASFSYIVPQRTVAEIIRLSKESENIDVVCDEKQIEFRAEGWQLISRIIEGSYPNHTSLVPTAFKTNVTLDVSEAVNTIRLVSLLSSRINDIHLKVDSKGVVMSAEDPDTGESSSLVKAEVEGDEISISFNWRYLLEGLQHITDKKALIRFIDNEKAALIQATKNTDYVYVVMPLRT